MDRFEKIICRRQIIFPIFLVITQICFSTLHARTKSSPRLELANANRLTKEQLRTVWSVHSEQHVAKKIASLLGNSNQFLVVCSIKRCFRGVSFCTVCSVCVLQGRPDRRKDSLALDFFVCQLHLAAHCLSTESKITPK